MKTSELTDAALDLAVAKCEGMPERIVFGRGSVRDTGYCVERPNGTRLFYILRNVWKRWIDKCETHPWGADVNVWTPSTNWAQGGPIIEREGILLRTLRNPGHSLDGLWLAMYDGTNTGTIVQWVKRTDWPRHYLAGPSPLVAAMRCYVASKLGNEVDIPAELTA